MNPATASPRSDRHVSAALVLGTNGEPKGFSLHLGSESTILEPGRTWHQIDHFKWATRGVIEPPQSFAVHPDGSVDLNGQTFHPANPEHADALTAQINKHHASASPPHTKPRTAPAPQAQTDHSGRVHFRVHLDAMSHLLVEATRGAERTETGLRGLAHLATDGWMRKPGQLHIDPLQRYLEIDGHRFACDAEGGAQLERLLNETYAPAPRTGAEVAIEIRENPGASTGFDIHFAILRAGTRFEIKGHLSQDKLDILQDFEKCGLLQPGTILRISPPFLYFRRRRSDGSEEHIPGIPEVKYRSISAPELQRLLNSPLIRRSKSSPALTTTDSHLLPTDLCAVRLMRHAGDHHRLWMDLERLQGNPVQRAFTHHNVAELMAAGIFRPGLEIRLSLDHRNLSITGRPGTAEQSWALEAHTGPEVLEAAARALTEALNEPRPVETAATSPEGDAAATEPSAGIETLQPAPASSHGAAQPPGPETTSKPAPAEPPRPRTPPPPARPAAAEQPEDPIVAGLFGGTDPHRINADVFRQLAERLHIQAQDVLLSLPRIFEDREFEILDFTGAEITSVLQLRTGEFYGFYLSHLGPERIDLVYACHGVHLEWGTDKCAVQPALGAETIELKGAALRGLAQNSENHFVFIVEPRYREFIRPHEKACAEAFAHFLTIHEWAGRRAEFPLIWPIAVPAA